MRPELTIDIKKILNDFSVDVQEGITKAAEQIAKQGAADLKATSPRRTGKYAKGWRVKTNKGYGFVECEIYNANSPGLTHLLEHGHKITRNGRKVGVANAKVHIKPVEEKVNREFEKAVEKIIQNGG